MAYIGSGHVPIFTATPGYSKAERYVTKRNQ